MRPVQFIDFRLSCFVGQTVGSLECMINVQATLQGLVALSIVQKLVPRNMVIKSPFPLNPFHVSNKRF